MKMNFVVSWKINFAQVFQTTYISIINCKTPFLEVNDNTDNADINDDDLSNSANEESATRKRRRSRSPDNDHNKKSRLQDPFTSEGSSVYKDSTIEVKAQSIAHKRLTRFSVNDHLYNLSINHLRRGKKPLVMNIAKGLKIALSNVLDSLKGVYGKDLHHQVYITIIENKILRGLNSGNYDINTPGLIIANRVLSMLYNYLKSFQTLRINPSFKVQVKVLSVPHMAYMQSAKRMKKFPNFRKRIYGK